LGESVEVTLLKSGKQATVIPSKRKMTIGGVYYTSMYDFDRSTYLTDLDTLYALNSDSPLSVGIFSAEKSEAVAKEIKKNFPDLEPITWKEANASLYGAMQLEQSMMTLMLLLMVAVIIIHIRNSSRRLLLAKQREIAMLRSMGLPKRQIQQLFVLQALIVSSVGALGGVLLSLVGILLYPNFSQLVYSSLGVHLKLIVDFFDLFLLVVAILCFSGFASYVGTRRILKADIMEMFAHDEVQ
jgi:lipoprotein-releasing system permease protein